MYAPFGYMTGTDQIKIAVLLFHEDGTVLDKIFLNNNCLFRFKISYTFLRGNIIDILVLFSETNYLIFCNFLEAAYCCDLYWDGLLVWDENF